MSDDEVVVEQRLSAWQRAAEGGEEVSAEQLAGDRPDLVPRLRQRIAALRQLDRLAGVADTASHAAGDSVPSADNDRHGEPLPENVGGYRVVALLGEGGMGRVLRAEDPRLGRHVALKVIRPELVDDAQARQRFLREARAAAALQHDHVVAIYQVGEDAGRPFIAMPLLAGESLEARLRRENCLAAAEVLRIGRETAEGLAAAHAAALVHRDVKPANLWLEAPNGRVKILDFGLARSQPADDGLTQTGAVLGTPAYMSPEQVNGEAVDARSDLFSLGCVLYRAATGQAPFEGKTLTALLRAVAERQPDPPHAVNPAVPLSLSGLILRLLAKSADARPASAAEVAGALHALEQRGQVPDAGRTATTTFLPDQQSGKATPARRLRPAWLLTGALLLAVVGGGLSLLASLGPGRKPEPLQADGGTAGDPTEPVKVLRLDVRHYVRNGEFEDYKARVGVAGGSFSTRLDDSVTVQGKLTKPAYCYLIGYRPDGKEDLCFPEDPAAPPPLTDEPRFPLQPGGMHYGLEEGEGLMVFVLVASRRPLPAYAEWRRSRGALPWRPTRAAPGVVWRSDGVTLRPATADDPEASGLPRPEWSR